MVLGQRYTRLRQQKVRFSTHEQIVFTILCIEPGLVEICLQLTEDEKKTRGQLTGSVALIAEGLNTERAQYVKY